jgi:hypothetical protein
MPLFAVERDLSQVAPDRFRSDLRDLVKACERLQGLGKKVRYISSAVFPSEARGLCLFGAEEPQWIRDVNDAARLPYLRIFAVLDLTPVGVRREVSIGRRTPQPVIATVHEGNGHREFQNGCATLNGAPAGPSVSASLARWSNDGRQLLDALGGWLEDAVAVQVRAEAVQSERDQLADDIQKVRAENEELRAERDQLQQTLQTLAGHMTHAADAILSRLRRRETPGDPTVR